MGSEPDHGSQARPLTAPTPAVVELGARWRLASGSGVVWSLAQGSDLNVNLVRLEAGAGIGEHVNPEVEVVLAVLEGEGEVAIDGAVHPLGPATLAFIPRGCRRSIRAGHHPLAYLSIHRRRQGLRVRPPA